MTEQEAIEELKYDCSQLGKSIPCDTSWGQAINTAYGMAIAALEKQIQKKYRKIQPCKSVNYYQCPCCGGLLHISEKFCGECGQALDWSEA